MNILKITTIIITILALFSFESRSQITINVKDQIVIQTDSCALSKDHLRWLFSDKSLIVLNITKNTPAAVQKVIEKYTIVDDDDSKLVIYNIKGKKYGLWYWKKLERYLGVIDVDLWSKHKSNKAFTRNYFYPIDMK